MKSKQLDFKRVLTTPLPGQVPSAFVRVSKRKTHAATQGATRLDVFTKAFRDKLPPLGIAGREGSTAWPWQ